MKGDNYHKDELGEMRTRWSEHRTLLAIERSFARWMGAGLACLGLALGLQAMFGVTEPTWIAKSAASLLVIIAIYAFQGGLFRLRRSNDRLANDVSESNSDFKMGWIAHALSFGSLGIGLVVWLI